MTDPSCSGCLIVQIHDHRSVSTSKNATTSTSQSNGDKTAPFSVHNYNEHLTPSSYVPFPKSSERDAEKRQAVSIRESPKEDSKEDESKLNGTTNTSEKQKPPQARIFTTVLHPTPLSLLMEMTLLASTPDPKTSQRRQSHGYPMTGSVPNSATLPVPSTPLSAVAPSSQSSSGPSHKKQKMMLQDKALYAFEAEVLISTASPLYLEPVSDARDASKVLHALRHPLHQGKPPAPKSRKRTIAELAADEALAAEEERFMLIMDERISSTADGATGMAKSDGQSGTASFEQNFSRFKTLESIKMKQEEEKKEKAAQAAAAEAARRAQHEQMEKARREQEEIARQEQQRREMHLRQQAAARAAQQQQQHAQQEQQAAHHQHTQPQPNGVLPNSIPLHLQQQTSQPQHSSPMVQHESLHSSPLMANGMKNQLGGIPMTMRSSSHGAGSPPRPPSATPQQVAVNMAHSISQRSQQGPSRHGTPQNAHLTPALQHATPVIRHLTPTPRMSHASPVPVSVAHTPVMGNNNLMVGTPHLNAATLSQQQRRMIHLQQQQAQAQAQQSVQVNGQQLSPQQIAALQAHRQSQLQQQQASPQQQQLQHQAHQERMLQEYNATIARQMQTQQQQYQQQQGHTGVPMPGSVAQNVPLQNQQPPQFQRLQPQNQQRQILSPQHQAWLQRLQHDYNGNIPPHILYQFRMAVMNSANGLNQQQQQQQQHAAVQQLRAQQMMAQMGRGGGAMMSSMNGMGAVQGQGRGMN